jgi:hypothetical protein
VTAIIPPPQHLVALAGANRVRLARGHLKAQIANGETTVADVLRDRPWEAETMTTYSLLMSQRNWGRTRTLRALKHIPVSEHKHLGALTDRQRTALTYEVAGTVPDA